MRLLACGIVCLVTGVLGLAACGSDSSAAKTTTTTPGNDGGTPSSSGSTTNPPGTTLPDSIVTTTTESLTVSGNARVYILSVPKNLDAAKTYPLVMSLHGSPGRAIDEAGGEPFQGQSGSDAIIVYPQALASDGDAWDWDLSNAAADNEDIKLIEALPQALIAKGLKIDTSKVFGYGYSGGGFFLQVYQCLGPHAFKAIFSSAGGAPESLKKSNGGPLANSNGCVKCPGTPVPEVIVFGQNDPAQGGDYMAMCQAELSACSNADADPSSLPDTTPTPCKKYDCAAEKAVTYCSIPNQDHGDWPQSLPTAWTFFKTFL